MKKLLTAVCVVGTLGLSAVAFADDMKNTAAATTEHTTSKVEKKVKGAEGNSTSSTEVKSDVNPAEAGGSVKTTEKTVKSHPANAKEHTRKTKETVTKDAHGRVTSDQKKAE